MNKKIIKKLLLSSALFASSSALAQVVIYPDFQISPEFKNNPEFNPSTYLTKYPVADTAKKLSVDEKQKLACLLVSAEKYSVEKFKQSFMVDLKQPLIALTMTNFPEIREMEYGGRKDAHVRYMSLSQISKGVGSQVDPQKCKV